MKDTEPLGGNAAGGTPPGEDLVAQVCAQVRRMLGSGAPRHELLTRLAAAAVVLTPDFCADDKWAELRHLPLALGFVGAWSVPIKSPDGRVLGTFGTSFRERRTPRPEERTGVGLLASVAAEVLTG